MLGHLHALYMKNLLIIFSLALYLSACTTVPYSTPQEHAAAKTFATKPGVANLYLYRDNRLAGVAVGWDVTLDGRMLGLLTAQSYMLREVPPGKHVLFRTQSIHPLELTPGRNYFVRVGARSFEQVPDSEGRRIIPKLKRVDTPF